MKKRVCRKQNKNPDTFGRRGKFGFPIDVAYFENAKYKKGKKNHNEVLEAVHKLNDINGTPFTKLIEKEDTETNEEIKQEIATWLKEAMQRLPKNQEISLYLRFWLDGGEPKPKNKNMIRTTQEVANIIGVSQPTAYRNIQDGLKKLKKDFKKNAQPKINKLKS